MSQEYFSDLSKLISTTDRSQLNNYLIFSFVSYYLPYLPEKDKRVLDFYRREFTGGSPKYIQRQCYFISRNCTRLHKLMNKLEKPKSALNIPVATINITFYKNCFLFSVFFNADSESEIRFLLSSRVSEMQK